MDTARSFWSASSPNGIEQRKQGNWLIKFHWKMCRRSFSWGNLNHCKPVGSSNFFNETTTSKGREIIDSGWNASGIKDAVKLGREKLPSFDPFEKLDPMMNETEDIARSTVLRMTAIACLLIEKLEVLVQWKTMKILTKKMTVNGSINLLNWMGEMVLRCLMTRCKSNRDREFVLAKFF